MELRKFKEPLRHCSSPKPVLWLFRIKNFRIKLIILLEGKAERLLNLNYKISINTVASDKFNKLMEGVLKRLQIAANGAEPEIRDSIDTD